MHSNVVLKGLMALVLVSCGLGCGIKTGEKNAEPEVARVKSAECLNQTVAGLKTYFKGDASDEQVSKSFECLQDVFIAFKENIRGQDKNSFTPREIATFVQINFLKPGDDPFTDEFLTQLMLFKVALFGGDAKVILKPEIDLVSNFLARFKVEFVKLNPYMKILTLNWDSGRLMAFDDSSKEVKFIAAKTQFAKFIRKLSFEFANGEREYKIDDLLGFATEVLRFAKSDQSTIDTVQKAGPFLKKFKSYLIGGNASLKGPEWEKIGLTLHEAYFQALRFEYFLKSLSPIQVSEKWVVYEKIATDLASLIDNLLTTKQSKTLTNHEIYDLLQPLSEIIPKVGLTEEILNELGDIKVMLLGDSDIGRNGWSKSDFEALNKKIPTLFKSVSALVEVIDYLTLEEDAKFRSGVNYADFEKAEIKILLAVSSLSSLLEKSYDLESFRSLIVHLAEGPFKDSFKIPENLDSLYNSALLAKALLTGQKGSLTTSEHLKLLLNVGIQGYLNYAEYVLFLEPAPFESVRFMAGLERLWPKIRTTLRSELAGKTSHLLTTAELTDLVLVLQKEKIIETKIKQASLNSLFNALWSNILNNPEDRLKNISLKGFDGTAITQISNEFEIWLGVQKNLAQIFEKAPAWGKNELLPELQARIDAEPSLIVKLALNDVRSLVNLAIPLTENEKGFLQILTVPSGIYHLQDLTQSNLARAVSRVAIRAYAKDLQRVNYLTGVTKEEVQVGYDQLKPLAVDLGVVSPDNTSFISSRFLESSLFLSVSDGNKMTSLAELHHLIIHLFSGVRRAGDIRPEILKWCVPAASSGDLTRVSEDCLLEHYATNESAFSGMPEFSNMRKQFTAAEVREYFMNLLKAAGHVPNAKKLVLVSDADLFPHVVQYLEMVYARHDTNRDHFLQKNEALAAFPVFKELLQDLVKDYPQIKENDLPGVFIYILKYGRPPKKTSIGELLKFVQFIKDQNQTNWDINSSRLDLGKIFNYIAESTSLVAGAAKPPAPPVADAPPATDAPTQQPSPQPEVPQPGPTP